MPYVTSEKRDYLKVSLKHAAQKPGELNYQITQVLLAYLRENQLNYTAINDILGALEGAKLEFYRRVAVHYEEDKRHENGEIY